MIVRWRALGKALDKRGAWSDELHTLANDLLGVPIELRDIDSPLDIPEGIEPIAHLRDVIASELESLYTRKEETLDEVDDALREATTLGLVAIDDPTLVLLRRYETASLRRQKWALDLLHKGRQRAEPIPKQAGSSYRERPRYDEPYVWKGPGPCPEADENYIKPWTDPDKDPTPGPGNSDRSLTHRDTPAVATERTQSSTGQLAERSHLAGRFRLLARSLAASGVTRVARNPRPRPNCRLTRPQAAPTRHLRPQMLGLIDLRIA